MYFIFLKELRFVEILFCQCFRNYKHIWYLVEDTCIKEVNSPHNISPYSFPPVPFFFLRGISPLVFLCRVTIPSVLITQLIFAFSVFVFY